MDHTTLLEKLVRTQGELIDQLRGGASQTVDAREPYGPPPPSTPAPREVRLDAHLAYLRGVLADDQAEPNRGLQAVERLATGVSEALEAGGVVSWKYTPDEVRAVLVGVRNLVADARRELKMAGGA